MVHFRYKNKGTVIHHLNPFCKLAWIVSILIFALIFDNPLYVLLVLLSTLPPIIMGKLVREWLSLMKFTLYLCIAIIVINAVVSNEGSHVLLEASFDIPVIGTPVITLEAIFFGLIMCFRLLAIISAFAILTFTIHPDDLLLSMIKLRLPYKSVLVTSLSTRFIPTLIDDLERITAVQKSRGIELDKGNLLQRMRNHRSFVIPLLSNSLDRAIQVAEAMEAKGFGSGENRTFYKDIAIHRIDVFALVLVLITTTFGIYLHTCGHGDFQYYPTISGLESNPIEWLALATLWLLLLTLVPVAFLKRKVELD